jgi:hypothetical protein
MGIVYEEKKTSCGIEMCPSNLLEVRTKTKIKTMNFNVLYKPKNGMMKAKTIQIRKTPSHK